MQGAARRRVRRRRTRPSRRAAQSAAEQARARRCSKAKLARSALEVNDCVLRAPFDGEIATPHDRSRRVRAARRRRSSRSSIAAPCADRRTRPRSTSTSSRPARKVTHPRPRDEARTSPASITRRAPAADPATRTVHFEVDLADPKREIPVGTTGEVHIDVGEPVAATEIPLYAATLRGEKATLFVRRGRRRALEDVCREGRGARASLRRHVAPGRRARRHRGPRAPRGRRQGHRQSAEPTTPRRPRARRRSP